MIDLFAGCGGLSLGFEQAGFRPLLVCELNRDAMASYLANRAEYRIEQFYDVVSLDDELLKGLKKKWRSDGIPEVDLVAGGPPCQGYSGIGHRRSYAVEKREIPSNYLYKEMVRIISVIRPKIFLFENVKGLLTARWTAEGQKGEIWRDVLATFQSLEGYRAEPLIVQAKSYGVPQNRPRVLIAGIRDDLGWIPQPNAPAKGLLPSCGGEPPGIRDLLSDLVDPNYRKAGKTDRYPQGANTSIQRILRTRRDGTVAKKGDPLSEHEYSEHSEKVRAKFEYMLEHDGRIAPEMRTKKFAQRLLPEAWDVRGPTITATSLPDDYVHYSQPRILTVREWARLQTFPDWYQFCGPRTTGGTRRAGNPHAGVWSRDVPRYTQIGNAVPVRLARVVAEHLAGFLA